MKNLQDRIVTTADYIIRTRCTVREAAEVMGYSKTAVHVDMQSRLRKIDTNRYCKVKMILDANKAESSTRAGLASQAKKKARNNYEKIYG